MLGGLSSYYQLLAPIQFEDESRSRDEPFLISPSHYASLKLTLSALAVQNASSKLLSMPQCSSNVKTPKDGPTDLPRLFLLRFRNRGSQHLNGSKVVQAR
jgi:hypothetical protein